VAQPAPVSSHFVFTPRYLDCTVVWRQGISERVFVIRVDGRGVDGDVGSILVYHKGERISSVATAEKNGDAEVILDKAAVAALAEALKDIT
jgi:hypothetical protein